MVNLACGVAAITALLSGLSSLSQPSCILRVNGQAKLNVFFFAVGALRQSD